MARSRAGRSSRSPPGVPLRPTNTACTAGSDVKLAPTNTAVVAEAFSDDHSVKVKAGDVLVLPSGSVHHIKNTSETERLYAVTIMANDLGSQDLESTVTGFEALVKGGGEVEFEEADKAVIFGSLRKLSS